MALGPGSIAFVGFNADGNDNVAFVALETLPAGTVIFFQDNEWSGTAFNTGESAWSWSTTVDVPGGTVIRIDNIGGALATDITASVGTATFVDASNRGLSSSDEIVYAFVGTDAATPTAFLTAFASNSLTSGASLDGTGLTAGVNAMSFGVASGADIAMFNGARNDQASFAGYASIINNPVNWIFQDGSGDQSIDTIAPDVPFASTAFTVTGTETQDVAFAAGSLAVSVLEGDTGTTGLSFTVERTGGTTGEVTFTALLSAGATDTADFAGNPVLPITINGTIAAGTSSSVVTIDVAGDTAIELNETFTLTLQSASNADAAVTTTLGANVLATGTIQDDDAPTLGGIRILTAAESLQGAAATPVATDAVTLLRLGAFTPTTGNSEVVGYDAATARMFVMNPNANQLDIVQIEASGSLTPVASVDLSTLADYGAATTVSVKNGIVAVGIDSATEGAAGHVALFDTNGTFIVQLDVGIGPDSLTFTPDGTRILVANEAEPGDSVPLTVGSVSIIDVSGGAAAATVTNTISFSALNGFEDQLRAAGIQVFPGQAAANDIEPEYIAVSPDGRFAYVTLQEVNAVAVIDLNDPTAAAPVSILPLGTIDRSLSGNVLDTSDQDGGINVDVAPILGLPQPDAIASFAVAGVTYFITANEGDSRVGLTDSVRFGNASYVLDPTAFPDAAALKANADLGRLNVLTNVGDTDGDGDFDQVYALGGRGFSIFRQNDDGSITKVRETGGEFERIIAARPDAETTFNQNQAGGTFDNRSDDKGPEPEGVDVGTINGRHYAFVALERQGGVMIYDVTDPANAFFVSYVPPAANDHGPEVVRFIAAADSPTGTALLLSANETSGTTTIYAALSDDLPQQVRFAAGSLAVAQAEGNAGTSQMTFTVERINGMLGQVDFTVQLAAGSAGSADFAGSPALPMVINGSIAAGQASTTITVDVAGDTTFEANETFTLTFQSVTNLLAGITVEVATTQSSATGTILNDEAPTFIGQVQGEGHVSPIVGQIVTLEGVVTAVDTNGSRGFYIQDGGDGNAATSDGIFVFLPAGTLPTVGNAVRVTGTVGEFTPNNAAPGAFSTTQLATVTNVTDLGVGTPVTPTVIGGNAGLLPPTEDLAAGGLFYERLEGMLVTVASPVAVGPRNSFGEIFTVVDSDNDPSNGLNATGMTPRGNLLITPGTSVFGDNATTGGDYNPERIQIDDDSGMLSGFSTPTVDLGARLNDVTGILRYDFGNYEVIATQAYTVAQPGTLVKETTTLAGGTDKLTVAAYNAENLDPGDGVGRFATIGAEIVNRLLSPDIIALQEVQDNDGATNSATIAADVTLQMLVDAVAAAGGPTYAFVDHPFIGDDTNGGQPGGNIRTAYLYRTDRVNFVEGSLKTIGSDGSAVTTSYIDQQTNPDNAFFDSRPPLVATFTFNGTPITVINNHFTSKGGSAPLLGSDQPPLNNGEVQRAAQAQAVNTFVDSALAANAHARIMVIGDLNEFPWEEPISVLKGSATISGYDVPGTNPSLATATLTPGGAEVLTSLTDTLPAQEQYDYVFDGNSQTLDHILVDNNLAVGAQYDVVRINAEFADQTSDHEPLVAQVTIPTFSLANYVRIGRFDLPEPTRTTAPSGSVLAQEVSAVTYNWDTGSLFVVGDGGTSIVQVTTTGQLIDSMTLAAGSSPQGTEFYDPEGLAYVGGGMFVMTEERDRQLVQFTYVADSTLTRAATQTVKLGTSIGNNGFEGLTYDPTTGGFIVAKEINPQYVFLTNVDFAAGTATNGSPTTIDSTPLFDIAPVGLGDLADVYALSNVDALDGLDAADHILLLSQESGKIVEVDRSGTVFSTLTILSDPGNPLSVADQQHEGMAMGPDGTIYVVSENGGGDFDHPQLWVYAPSAVPNTAPTALSLENPILTIVENASTVSRVKVANIAITDDGLGVNTLALGGADAAFFEVDTTGLFIKAGTVLDFETKSSYSVTVTVDDATVGGTPDATTNYSLSVTDVVNEDPAAGTLYISEVAPWSSGNSPVGADWFEVTNTSSSPIDITGWKFDDSSAVFASAVALNGITMIGAGESVIFVESNDPTATVPSFLTNWFGATAPAGLQIGTYTGSGVGLSTGGDQVNLFDASGTRQVGISFGASTIGPFQSFNNAAGLNNTTITTLSEVGTNGAFTAVNSAQEIGSPGTIGRIFISEVAPWSSGDSPIGFDWFEVTNTSPFAVDITGWKMDDSSGSPAAAVTLNGVTSIAAGESVIFIESSDPNNADIFRTHWFGANVPAALQVGTYSGAGVGLGSGGDAIHLYDAGNGLRASVTFGTSPTPPNLPTFDNASAMNATTISTLSSIGTNGAFAASAVATEVGSPGRIIAPPYTLQILHFYGESGTLGIETAPIMGAMIDHFRSATANTLLLGEGDTWIPGPWLVAGADPSLSAVPGIGSTALARPDIAIFNAFGVDASALGNHEFDLGSAVVSGAIGASGSWVGAQFPFITSNLDFSADSALRGLADATLGGTATNNFAGKEASDIKGKIAPYSVVTVNGEKIGIVGSTTFELLSKTSPNGTVPKDDGNPATDDLQEVAALLQASVDALRATGVNKIVMVDQLDSLERNKLLAPMVSGIDVMVAGGGHERMGDANDVAVAFNGHDDDFIADGFPIMATDKDGNPTLIVTTDTEFTYLGRLQVEFDAAGILNTAALDDVINGAYASSEAILQLVTGSSQSAAEIVAASATGAKVQAIVDAIDTVITVKDGNKFGFSNVYLEGDRVFGRAQETNLGNLTADANGVAAALALFAEAEGGELPIGIVSLKNGGGLRASIGSVAADGTKTANPIVDGAGGNISQLDVENALRFDNKLMVFDTTPQGLLNILNFAAEFPAGNGGFPQVGGIRFSFDPDNPVGAKVVSVALYDPFDNFLATVVQNGVVVPTAPATIPVVILNFTANGGDGYPIRENGENFRYLQADLSLPSPLFLSDPVDEALDFTNPANVPAGALGEQMALELFLRAFHGAPETAFSAADTPADLDLRIENLNVVPADSVIPPPFTLQILHFYAESGLLGIETAPIMGAMIDRFDDLSTNTLVLGEGDTWIPGPWLTAGADPSLSAIPGIGSTGLARPDIAILNAFGVDASALGNHEFDLGSPVLAGAIAASGAWPGALFPIITSNLDFAGDSALRGIADATIGGNVANNFAGKEAASIAGKIAPYTVVTMSGEMVGIIGSTTFELLSKSSPNGTVLRDDGDPTTDDGLEEAAVFLQNSIDALKAMGVNKIVMVDEIDDIDRNRALAPMLSGIDIMVAGAGGAIRQGDSTDTATAFNGHEGSFNETYPVVTADKDGNPTLIVTTDTEFTYLGRLVVEFDANGILDVNSFDEVVSGAYVSTEASLQAVYGTTQSAEEIIAGSTIGTQVQTIVDAIDSVVTVKGGTLFGYSDVYLEGDRAFGRFQEVNLGNLTADANAAKALPAVGGEIMVSLKNGGGIRASIGSVEPDGDKVANPLTPNGNVSLLDVENALRFDNRLMVFDTTPQGLLNIMNFAAGLAPGNGGFPQIGGMRFSYDPDLPAGSRVQDIALYDQDGNLIRVIVNDGVIDPSAPATIPVVILNFTANGGDSYPIKANGENFRYLLTDGTLSAPVDEGLDFTAAANVPANAVGEQKALQDFMLANHGTPETAYDQAETPAALDLRIQNLNVVASDTVICFAAGTRIATPNGMVKVENLRKDDLVDVVFGTDPRTVVWVGYRTVDCTRHPEPRKVWPVRVKAGAFGPRVPLRDLYLSPDHAVFAEGVLIPIKHLINGTSIAQVAVDTVTYYHVELASHDVLLAEGLPAESYLDAGDRGNFSNADGPIRLFPDFSGAAASAMAWEAFGCAPLRIVGTEVEKTRKRIADRAAKRTAAAGRRHAREPRTAA